jgi:XTP/dITP diphosphohydrolase
MTNLVIATGNPGKIRELRALLQHLPITLINPHDLSLILQIEEQNDSYSANAKRKALAYAEASNMWCLADDSGLEVDALEGAPGLQSARLAGPGRSDADRRSLLLELLQSHPRPWTARFRCVVALSSPTGEVTSAEGICEGEILPHERGENGFGYDPIFLLKSRDQTMAELSMEDKNQLSHRARAVHALLPVLGERLGIR